MLVVGSLDVKASRGDVGHAVGLLTTQPAEVHDTGEDPDSHAQAWEAQKGIDMTVVAFFHQTTSWWENVIIIHII